MNIEAPYARPIEEIKESLEVNPETGLSEQEIEHRLEKYGRNKMEEQDPVSIWKILFDQINTPVVYLLSAAAALSFIFGDLPEGFFIVGVIFVNAAIGFWMEFQAKKSMKALQEMDKLEANVLRDGEQVQISAEELVPGDLLIVSPGDLVAADARLIEASELEVNESALTGESVPVAKQSEAVEKSKPLAERSDMLYKGTAITRGKGRAIVVATGMETEIGNISEMVQTAEGEEIPLDKKLGALTRKLIWIVLGMAAVLGLVSSVTDRDLYTIVQTAIAWAIAAIPEGLPIVASIALARGMLRLADKQVIVKKLSAVEALGETNVIFTDKTGTLTENQLSVELIADPEEEIDVNETSLFDNGEKVRNDLYLNHLFLISVLANDALYDADKEEESQGDPLEIALLRFTRKIDKDRVEKLQQEERVGEDPFDSEDKRMGTVYRLGDKYYTAAKGAASAILSQSSHILNRNGEVESLGKETKDKWQKKNDELAERGLRTLAFAYRETADQPDGVEEEDFLHELTFVGLIGFIDPPREDVASAIETCRKAGIEVVMVTGDHPGTSRNVAEQVNMVEGDSNTDNLSSEEIKEADDKEIVEKTIFSRVSPGEKLDIVEKFQKQGKIVGMTGDGVNDAPALKKADIGIAMGKRGTQVAKETADLVLKDDNFSSIVNAIREGRIVFHNIRKFIVYQLSYHLGEILVIAAVSFSVFKLPLLPLQLLFLNILSDVFPALALGIGEGRENVMEEPPKDPEEPFLHRASWVSITVYAVVIAVCVAGTYLLANLQWGLSHAVSNNIAFFSLAIAQLLHVFDMRDPDEDIFRNQVTRNKYVWMAVVLCSAALAIAYFVPGLRELLSFQVMGVREWSLIAVAGVLPLIINQIIKAVFKVF